MDHLIKSLPSILRSGESEELIHAAALVAWKHAAGEGLRNHAVPLRLENRTLFVGVADAVWQKQMRPMCGQLLFRVNTLLGQPLVSRIEIQIDPALTRSQTVRPKQNKELKENEVPFDLWSAASAISDRHLRQSFLRAAVSATRRLENR